MGGVALVVLAVAVEGAIVIAWMPRSIAVLGSMWMVVRPRRSEPLTMREAPAADGTRGDSDTWASQLDGDTLAAVGERLLLGASSA